MPDDLNRKPTEQEAAGIAWWNALTEQQRAEWLRRANSARPSDAWKAYCAEKSPKP
jgi:hypothetical protein